MHCQPSLSLASHFEQGQLTPLALPFFLVCRTPQQTLRALYSLCDSHSECLVQSLEESAVDVRAVARSPPLLRDYTEVNAGRSLHGLLHPEGVLQAVLQQYSK